MMLDPELLVRIIPGVESLEVVGPVGACFEVNRLEFDVGAGQDIEFEQLDPAVLHRSRLQFPWPLFLFLWRFPRAGQSGHIHCAGPRGYH